MKLGWWIPACWIHVFIVHELSRNQRQHPICPVWEVKRIVTKWIQVACLLGGKNSSSGGMWLTCFYLVEIWKHYNAGCKKRHLESFLLKEIILKWDDKFVFVCPDKFPLLCPVLLIWISQVNFGKLWYPVSKWIVPLLLSSVRKVEKLSCLAYGGLRWTLGPWKMHSVFLCYLEIAGQYRAVSP